MGNPIISLVARAIRGALRPLNDPYGLGNGVETLPFNLAVWDAAAGSYGKLNEPVELATGETIEVYFRTVNSVNWQTLIGGYSKLDKTVRKGEVRVTDAGRWSFVGFDSAVDVFLLDGRTLSNNDPYVADGKIHKISLTRGDSESSLSYMYDHIGVKAIYYVNSNVTLANHYDQPILAVNVYKADGTPKHKFNFLGLLSDQRSVLDSVSNDKLRYVPDFDGNTHYIILNQPIQLEAGYILKFKTRLHTDWVDGFNNSGIFRQSSGYFMRWHNFSYSQTPNIAWDTSVISSVKIDDIPRGQNTTFRLDNNVHTFEVTISGAVEITEISNSNVGRFPIYDIEIYNENNILVYGLPLNDNSNVIKSTNATLGSELVDCTAATGRVATLSNVTKNSFTLTNTIASYGTSEQVVNLEAGTYLLEFDTVNLNPSTNSGGFVTFTPSEWTERVDTYTSVEGLNKTLITIPQSGTYKVWFHVGGSVQGDSRRYSNITLKKATGYASYNGAWKQIPENPDTRYVELVNFAQAQIRPYIESVPYHGYIYQDMGVKQRPAYKFDGTAYAKLRHPRKVFAGQTVSFTFQIDDISDIANRFWLDAADAILRASVTTGGNWNAFGSADDKTFIDGVDIPHGTDLSVYADGLPHVLTMTIKQDCTLQYIMSSMSAGQQGKGYLFDLKVDDELVLPMDDGVGSVMRNVGFGLDADIISHNPDNWNFLPKYRDNYITRNIVELDASAGGRVDLPNKIVIPTDVDFSIKYVFYCGTDVVNPASNIYLLGGNNSTFNRKASLYVSSGTDSFSAQLPKADGSTFAYRSVSAPTNPYNRIVEVVLQRVAGQTNIVVDGVAGGTTTQVLAQLEFDYVNGFANVINCDVRPIELDVRVDGKQAYYYDFNLPKGETIVPNLCEPKGVELWNGRTEILDNAASSIATIETNESYLVTVSDFTGNLMYASGSGWKALSVGDNIVKVTSGTTLSLQNFTQASTGMTFSVRKITNWAELVNVPTESNKTYTWSDEHKAWVSENLAVYTEVTIPKASGTQYGYIQPSVVDPADAGRWIIAATIAENTGENDGREVGFSSNMSGVPTRIGDGFRDVAVGTVLGGVVNSPTGGVLRLFSNYGQSTFKDIAAYYLLPKA